MSDSSSTDVLKSDATTPPPGAGRSKLRSIAIAAACTSAMMINNANAQLAISLPLIGRDLNVPQVDLQWFLTAYAISSASFLLLAGRLADLYGRKRMWILGYILITFFGLGCGFAQTGTQLFVLRGFQGLGGAVVIPASLGILAHSFEGRARSLAFATFAAGAPLGGMLSFILGSVLIQLTAPGWRSPHYVFTGMAFLGTIGGMLAIEPDKPSTEEDRRVDWLGALLTTAGLVLIVFVLSDSPIAPRGWKTGYIIALFVVGWILIIAFVAWQWFLQRCQETPGRARTWWTPPPLMKLSVFTRGKGKVAIMQAIALIDWAAFSVWVIYVQLYYQDFLGLTPIHSMVRMLPSFVTGIFANVTVAYTIGRVGVHWLVGFGTLLMGISLVLFAIIKPSITYWAYSFPSTILIVFGADFVFAPGTLLIAKVTPPQEQSVAAAVFQTMTLIGTAVGISISTIVYNGVLSSRSRRVGIDYSAALGNAPKSVQLIAYRDAFWAGTAFAMFCLILCVALRGVGIVGAPPAPKEGDRSVEVGSAEAPSEKEPVVESELK